EQITRLTGVKPDEANVDLGYRGHGIKGKDTEIILSHQKRGMTPAKRNRQKRRNAIEPIIGHCKNDRKVGPRNWLHGKRGDQINALAMAIGFNLRKILRWIFLYLLFSLVFRQKIHSLQMVPAKSLGNRVDGGAIPAACLPQVIEIVVLYSLVERVVCWLCHRGAP